MKQYLDQWKVIEGSLREERIEQLPDCLEKEHLFRIREMLRNEQFDPNQFLVVEYPATGVYCCNHVKGEKYFIIELFSANSLSGAISVYIISKERWKKKWLIQLLELLLKKAETISFL